MTDHQTIRDDATGIEVGSALRAEAMARGVSLTTFLRPLTSNGISWLQEVERAGHPRPRTIERVRLLLAGQSIDEALRRPPAASPTYHRPTGRGAEENARIDRLRAEAERIAEARDQRNRDLIAAERASLEAAHRIAADRPYVAPALSPAEAIVTAIAATPSDAVRVVQRRWPHVWEAVLLAARRERRTPGEMMVEAIERGLGVGEGTMV